MEQRRDEEQWETEQAEHGWTSSEDDGFSQRVRVGYERVQHGVKTLDQSVRHWVEQRPLTALSVAVGIGYLIGKLISRRRS